MPMQVPGYHTNTPLHPSFETDIRDVHLIYDYDAEAEDGTPQKWRYEMWFFSHDRIVYSIHGGPMAGRLNYQTVAFQCIRPGELWQCNWLEETGTIVSLVYDIVNKKITTMIGFSKGHWENSKEAHGDKRNPQDYARWRKLAEFGNQRDRLILSEQATILKVTKGAGTLEPIAPDAETFKFPIDIERSATVRELQEAIYRHERFNQQFQGADAFTADELALFHARDVNGVWVPEDEKLKAFLKGEVDRSLYRMLNPAWQLQDEACFGTDPEGLPDKVIHVLVELPFGDDEGSGNMPQTGSYVSWYLGSREGREITEFVHVRMEEVATEEFTSEQAELMNAQRHNEFDAYVEAILDGVRTSTRFRVRICDASPDSEF